MRPPGSPRRVTVVGAGVVGLAIAVELARHGASTELIDAGAPSASAAAAGMIAPASEALLEDVSAGVAAAFGQARRRWDVWAERLGIPLDRGGACHLAPDGAAERMAEAARRLGFAPRAGEDGTTLILVDDAVLDPGPVLEALRRMARGAGVQLRAGRVNAHAEGLSLDGSLLEGEVVVAAGWGSAALAAAAPELGMLEPIKGQLLRLTGGRGFGPTLRASGVYIAPQLDGWMVGATMEPGRDDVGPDALKLAGLRRAAEALLPELVGLPERPAIGVRAATPDGLPLVGRSSSGVWLATGMRRNGWLLAPLVAEGLAAYLRREDPDPFLAGQASAWAPTRIQSLETEPS